MLVPTDESFITCSNLIINELGRCPTRTDNIYFANNEQASLAVYTVVFCFTQTEHNLIKLKGTLMQIWKSARYLPLYECDMLKISH